MVFSTSITVRFADCDPVGFVYYPRVLHYCHVCMEEFFAERCGITYQKLLDDERIGFATVKIEAEYFVPLLYGDTAEAQLDSTTVLNEQTILCSARSPAKFRSPWISINEKRFPSRKNTAPRFLLDVANAELI
jgi:YbgC/YbaW family acyl-CoA thioester hydrolase